MDFSGLIQLLKSILTATEVRSLTPTASTVLVLFLTGHGLASSGRLSRHYLTDDTALNQDCA
jgi:hypothetical protein